MDAPRKSRLGAAAVLAALLAACAAWAAAAAGGESPAGRTVYAGGGRVDLAVFSGEAVHVDEKPAPAVVFDKDKIPSGYRTCYQEARKYGHLKILRPYDRAAFPPNLAPPRVRWADPAGNIWMLSVKAPGWAEPMKVVTDRREWRFDAATWRSIVGAGSEGWTELELRGARVEQGRRSGDLRVDRVRFRVSEHECDPVVVYRLVTPLFHGIKTPDIFYRDVSTYEQKLFLPSKGYYCTNCHSFPVKPTVPRERMKLAVAVRRSVGKERYRIFGLYKFATKEGRTLNINSFFMAWHPDGNKVCVTGGLEVSVRPLITLETQEFYVKVADILVIDTKTLEATPLPGASSPRYMETLPTWSPDGRTIVFSRADELGHKFEERKFDLYRVPYNGGNGGKAEPIPGASHNGLSNYAARFSPDGRWIVFNKANYSSLVAPTAKLWIVSTGEGAKPRKLECNNPHAMDSHHSWSSNSRWLLFASKRDDGIFARLYMTEIDGEGRASPPVGLPCLDDPMMCYNVPEFLRYRLPIDADDILAKTGSLKKETDPE